MRGIPFKNLFNRFLAQSSFYVNRESAAMVESLIPHLDLFIQGALQEGEDPVSRSYLFATCILYVEQKLSEVLGLEYDLKTSLLAGSIAELLYAIVTHNAFALGISLDTHDDNDCEYQHPCTQLMM